MRYSKLVFITYTDNHCYLHILLPSNRYGGKTLPKDQLNTLQNKCDIGELQNYFYREALKDSSIAATQISEIKKNS